MEVKHCIEEISHNHPCPDRIREHFSRQLSTAHAGKQEAAEAAARAGGNANPTGGGVA